MSNARNLISSQNSLGNVATHIGSCLWWQLPKTSVERQKLEDTATNCGVPDRYLPEPIKFIGAFKRAIATVKTPLEKDNLLLRKLGDDNYELVYAIVAEKVSFSGKQVDHKQIGTVSARKNGEYLVIQPDTSYVSSTCPEYQLVEQVKLLTRSAHTDALLHNTNDIRSVITAFTTECGISLRDSGGIYFIPLIHQPTLDSLVKFVQTVSPSATMYVKPEYIMRDSDLEALRKVTQSELANEIASLEDSFNTLQSDLDTMISANERPGVKKQKQLTNQLSDYNAMRDRIKTFSGTLNFAGDQLTYKLNSIHKSMESKLDKLRIRVKSELRASFEDSNDDTAYTVSSHLNTVPDDLQPVTTQTSTSNGKATTHSTAVEAIASINKLLADLDI